MLKIAFLCSGGGGNLRFMREVIHLGWISNATICGVITDRDCLANQFARDNNIWTIEVDFSEGNQLTLIDKLQQLKPDIIITTVHKILSSAVVDVFRGRLVNLHYSLLPAFGGVIGTTPVKLALAYGVQVIGTTVHLVDTSVDTGMPLVQTAIPVEVGDSPESLMDIIFRCGCISLLNGLQILRSDSQQPVSRFRSHLDVSGRAILINPMILYCSGYENESFWQQLKLYPLTKDNKEVVAPGTPE